MKMKLLFLLFVTAIIACVVYMITSKWRGRIKKNKKYDWKPAQITTVVVFLLLALIAFGLYSSANQPDMQCASAHITTTKAPTNLKTAADYFNQGNYDYDIGHCPEAVADYTQAITFNPSYPQAYNNRAYTYMRLKDYKDALPDLDKAIQLNPNYIQALMNRGDIHNYYYQIDRQAAIADYKRVIALTGQNGRNTSVCGHLFLAKHNGWTFWAYLNLLTGAFRNCE